MAPLGTTATAHTPSRPDRSSGSKSKATQKQHWPWTEFNPQFRTMDRLQMYNDFKNTNGTQ